MATIGERRFRTQRLTGPRFRTVAEVVSFLGAVQAQDYPGAKWAVAQRTAKLTDADLDAALDAGAIFRTHIMRPTWHFVMPEDIRWMLALTSHRVHAISAPYHRKQGLDARVLSTFHTMLGKALEGGRDLTKAEIVKLATGTSVPADPFTLSFAIMHAELEGLIASGPRRGRQHTWALLDERAPPQPSVPKEEALARLASRYFASHGPAEDKDMAWWSGLTLRDVRAGIALAGETLKREEIDGRTLWSAADEPASVQERPIVHLLPNYDEIFIAFNQWTEPLDFELPPLRHAPWRRVLDTGRPSPEDIVEDADAPLVTGERYRLDPRAVALLIAVLPPTEPPTAP